MAGPDHAALVQELAQAKTELAQTKQELAAAKTHIAKLTDEVVRLKPDVILASAIIAAFAARKATSTIPIVSPALADAVHLGLIVSEARPAAM